MQALDIDQLVDPIAQSPMISRPDDGLTSRIALVVVAAGRSARMGEGLPKPYRRCGGRPLLATTLEAFARAFAPVATTVVIHPDDAEAYGSAIRAVDKAEQLALTPPAFGAPTRQGSVLAGLETVAPAAPDLVLIQDAARPFASVQLIERAIDAGRRHGAAAPGAPVVDTIAEIDAEGAIAGAPPRERLRAMQTPQAFRFALILDAHRRARAAGVADLTDDVAVARWAGHAAFVFPGERDNFKVTTSDDLRAAEARLTDELADIRVGQGFDVHAFAEGDGVWLGGVRIPFSRSLAGHSDADVALHALADAIYGALAEGDIGQHFPPSDARWRGAPSQIFLAQAAERVARRGGLIAHLDLTIVCEAPKIGPFRDAIRKTIADIARLELDQVAVKATTSEGLGFTGRGEGIACLATATIRLPRRG